MIDGDGNFAKLPDMTKKTRHRLLAISILTLPFVLFLGFFIFLEEPLPPLAPLPEPNGYDDLVKAGGWVSPDVGNYGENNTEQLRELVSSNAAALSLARVGLSRECRVPVQYSLSYISNHLNDLAGFKMLAQAFAAEGRLAELENRPADAAKSYLDLIALADKSARGGVLIDGLVGMAIEEIGRDHLQNLVSRLGAHVCRETATSLETLDSQAQSWDEIVQQENAWSRGTYRGWRYDLMRLQTGKSMAAAIAKSKQNFNGEEQKTRQLIIALAARAYELEKGHPPASAADLAPEYLKAVPRDPFTGRKMVLSP